LENRVPLERKILANGACERVGRDEENKIFLRLIHITYAEKPIKLKTN
jgi:hypothetical protein